MTEATPRRQVRDWIRSRIANESSMQLPELSREMVQHFSRDPDFVSAWLAETLAPLAYEETQSVCGQTRSGHILFGDTLLSRDAAEERFKRARPRWNAWLEHVGDRQIRLMDMTKQDLLIAASERQARGENEIRRAEFWREIASGLRGRKTVGDVFTEEQLDELAGAMSVSIQVDRKIAIREALAA